MKYIIFTFLASVIASFLIIWAMQPTPVVPALKFHPAAPTLVAGPSFGYTYHHAIVRGGIVSVADLRRLILSDPELAKLYAGFDLETAHFERLGGCRIGFVSYRGRRGVFYKTRPTVICDEEVLVDARGNMIRVKCGNRIQTTPPSVVDTDPEPTDSELETPEPEIPEITALPLDFPSLPTDPIKPEVPVEIGWTPPPCPTCGIFNGPPVATPEPGTLILTGLGAFLLIVRRRGGKK